MTRVEDADTMEGMKDYTVKEVQTALGYKSRQAVNYLVARGVIVPSRLAPVILIPQRELDKALALKGNGKYLLLPRKARKKLKAV